MLFPRTIKLHRKHNGNLLTMIKKLVIGCLFSLITCMCFAGEIVDLYVGEIKILKVGDIKRVAVGNAKLLSTSMLNNGQLLLIAEAEGVSNVHIWYSSGLEEDITVRIDLVDIKAIRQIESISGKADEVRALLADVGGLKVRIVGERVVLSGRVDAVYKAAIDTVKAAFIGIMDLTISDLLDLPVNKMVIMNIKFTEFNKNYLETLGINWDTTIAGPAAALALDGANNSRIRATPLPTPSFNSDLQKIDEETQDVIINNAASALGYFGIVAEITSRINFAVDSGNALILAEPRLATRSGGKATFLAGGEIPFQTSSINGTTTEFKEFGIHLSIEPIVDQNNYIQAHVETEVSAIDPSVSVGGVPGFLSRKTSTDISMRSGETLVISGLINQQASKNITKVKFLGDIPIIGALFRSQTFRDQRSELVIFVTPTVYDADSTLNKTAREYGRKGIESVIEAIDEKSLDILE